MYLRSVQIENYRAIREGSLTFDETTILFGENDSGRSSIIEALVLILGSASEVFESRLRPFHFHRGEDGLPGPMRIRINFREEVSGSWKLPDSLEHALPKMQGRPREVQFEFRATLDDSTQAIRHAISFSTPGRSSNRVAGTTEALTWLRELIPVLWLRSGLVTEASSPDHGATVPSSAADDPALRAVEAHHRNLLHGNTPDLAAELEGGAKAAHEVIRKYRKVFAGAGPLMSAMASEILNRSHVSTAPESQSSTMAYKIAELLLLGAILQLVRRRVSAYGKPVLIIENPESNLHPMTLAAAWRILERIVWQKIIATNSGTILSSVPLASLRRITRNRGIVTERCVHARSLSTDTLRRVSYHLRSRRATAMFARCWLLVEGETEYWVVPELGRLLGFDFAAEGVECVEFAQCGLAALTKLADHLGIAWHVLVDGDDAGQRYAATAMKAMRGESLEERRITRLREDDIEHCFWENGFDDVIRRIAYPGAAMRATTASAAIRKAIERHSKPFLALKLIDAVAQRGTDHIPPILKQTIEAAIASARLTPAG